MKIALIGKTNVGKSTLFNRLVEEKKAIVSDEDHTTRDRNYGQCQWRRQSFVIIDVGGISTEKLKEEHRILEDKINDQIKASIKEADLIIFLVDAKNGLNFEDRLVSEQLKKNKKPIIFVANKADSLSVRNKVLFEENFLKFGFGEPLMISAANGNGVGDLLDSICEISKKLGFAEKEESEESTIIEVAIVGRTNVGKSTLVNSLLDQDRVIVSTLPHTTREPIDIDFFYNQKHFVLVDTAGIRKKNKIKSNIERIGINKSLEAIKKAKIVVLMIDLTQEISQLEKELVTLIKNEKKGVILTVNKFDLAENKVNEYLKYYEHHLDALWWAPIVFISAKEKKNLNRLLAEIISVDKKMKKKYNEEDLDRIFQETITKYLFKQKYWPKTKIVQIDAEIPTFIIKLPRITSKELMPRSAQYNLIEKELHQKLSIWGTPVNLIIGSSL
jgi:GTPase